MLGGQFCSKLRWDLKSVSAEKFLSLLEENWWSKGKGGRWRPKLPKWREDEEWGGLSVIFPRNWKVCALVEGELESKQKRLTGIVPEGGGSWKFKPALEGRLWLWCSKEIVGRQEESPEEWLSTKVLVVMVGKFPADRSKVGGFLLATESLWREELQPTKISPEFVFRAGGSAFERHGTLEWEDGSCDKWEGWGGRSSPVRVSVLVWLMGRLLTLQPEDGSLQISSVHWSLSANKFESHTEYHSLNIFIWKAHSHEGTLRASLSHCRKPCPSTSMS